MLSSKNYDVILSPVYAQTALPMGTSIEDPNFRGFSYTMAYNVVRWPAAVVCCARFPEGLHIAVQVAARPYREDIAIAVVLRLEEIFGGWQPPKLVSRNQ